MLDRFARRLYQRLGNRYRLLFPLAQDPPVVVVATLTIVLLTSFYERTSGELLVLIGIAVASSLASVSYALLRGRPYLEQVMAWLATPPGTSSDAETIAAWDAATNFPMRSFRANSFVVGLIAAGPPILAVVLLLELPPIAVPVLLLATILPVAYATALNYFIAELLMRPVVEDVARRLPEDFPFAANGLLVRQRLKFLLPTFTSFAGFVVAAIMTDGNGTDALAASVGVAIGVGLLLSYELTVLLSRSVTAPIADLRAGLAGITAGDLEARVPVVTSDELGELAQNFNMMAAGLAERERIREAFGTYLDRDIAPLILSGNLPQEGVQVTVSIMFVDVRGFTAFAERSAAAEVVAALNRLFEVMVPIVAEHGGHVDKFLGDGLLATFGAPEGWIDHADRALAAGLQIADAINLPEAELQVGVGINTGSVVAGAIGGAGRLNFSVIGDAVNVSARVEAATRDTGDDLLITSATRAALTRPLPLVSRGTVPLKGKSEPVEILAPAGPRAAQTTRDLAAPARQPG